MKTVTRVCQECEIEFEVSKNRIGKYCSTACTQAARRTGITTVTRNCEECGAEFQVRKWAAEHGKGKYCSQSCTATANNRSRGYIIGRTNDEYLKVYYQNNREKYMNRHRKYKYGVSPIAYQTMLEQQQYRCAICGDLLDLGKHTHTDHSHKTNKFRGILCEDCNHGVGGFRDNITFMQRAMRYLRKNESPLIDTSLTLEG